MYECPSEQGRGLRLCWCTSQVAPIHGARDAPSATTSVDPTSVTHVWEAAMKDDEEVARQKHLIALLKHLRADHQLGPAAVYQCVVVLWALARAREDLSRLVPFAEVEDELAGLLKPFAAGATPPDPAVPWFALRDSEWWQLDLPQSDCPPGTGRDAVRRANARAGLSIEVQELVRSDDTFRARAMLAIRSVIGGHDAFEPLLQALVLLTKSYIASQPEWDVAVGELMGRRELHKRFGGGRHGRIEPSFDSPNVFLFSNASADAQFNFDHDGWGENGTYILTGEAQVGSQVMTVGNRAVLDHVADRSALRLFRSEGTSVRYLGEFAVDPVSPYTLLDAPDRNSDIRKIIHFILRPVGEMYRPSTALSPVRTDAQGIPQASQASVEYVPESATWLESQLRREAATTQLRTVATWALRERSFDEAKALWQFRPELDVPPSVAAAWDAFLTTRLSDLAEEDLLHDDVGRLANELLNGFCPSHREVLRERVLSPTPLTLAEVGSMIGVSRARVGQIQKTVEERLEVQLTDRRFLPLLWRAEDLAKVLGAAAPVLAEPTRQALLRASRDCPVEMDTTLRSLVLYLAGSYRIKGDWLVRRGSTVPDARQLETLADDHGLLSVSAAKEWLTQQEVNPHHFKYWLNLSGRFRCFDDTLAVWSGSVVDKCVSILAIRGAPADTETLVSEVGEGHNARGVRARLFEEPRVMRTSRSNWGLRTWQLEEYTGITEEIAQRIQEWGGRAKIADLVDELVQSFGVSAGSVRTYADAPMFITEDGYVRLRGSEERFPVNHDLSRCRGVFQISESSFSYLIPMDRDVLRGSGRNFPDALAAALGVRPGKTRSFSTAGGQLKVYWPETSPLGPSLGSTRALATDVGGVEGDLMRLQFDVDRDECIAFRLRLSEMADLSDNETITALTGIQEMGDDMEAAVADSVGTDNVRLVEVLRQRGDDKLANLLPAPQMDDALKDALSKLVHVLDDLA